MKTNARINCYRCTHFFVTWEEGRPYGCKRLNFKSTNFPSLEVYRSSGLPCQYFEPKRPQQRGN